MKCLNVFLGITTLALGIAGAAAPAYDLRLTGPTWVGATQLQPGQYKVEIEGEKAIFKKGKSVVEVPVTIGAAEKKFTYTSFTISEDKMKEIDFAGTKSKVMFAADAPAVKGN